LRSTKKNWIKMAWWGFGKNRQSYKSSIKMAKSSKLVLSPLKKHLLFNNLNQLIRSMKEELSIIHKSRNHKINKFSKS
jgi:hypothetical protein